MIGHPQIDLVRIRKDGRVAELAALPRDIADIALGTATIYDIVGFVEPWIGYLAVRDGVVVGTCAFKGPPRQALVEISFLTFPGHEGQGVATHMARRLIAIANNVVEPPMVGAQTPAHDSAATRVLRKAGFVQSGTSHHPEDGPLWDWTVPRPIGRGDGARRPSR